MNQLAVLWGAIRYEFRMQIRRPSLWITMIAVAGLVAYIEYRLEGANLPGIFNTPSTMSIKEIVVHWTQSFQSLFPVAVGCLMADRFPRDKRTKVYELLQTFPGALGSRLWGKYIGATLATILPGLLFYATGIGGILYHTHNVMAIPFAIASFAAIALPGLLFVSAFAIVCTSFLWTPLFQFLFIGYWFWGNVLNPHLLIPSLNGTILTPSGGYMSQGFFGVREGWVDPHAGVGMGLASLLLLLGIAIGVLIALWGYVRWQQAHQ